MSELKLKLEVALRERYGNCGIRHNKDDQNMKQKKDDIRLT